MKMIVAGVPSTWANYAIVSVPNDSGKLNVTGLWNFALSCANVGATLRVIGNWGISATPVLDDLRLLGSETSLKRTKNVGVACNLRADIQHFMLVFLDSWHCRAANITQKWCCTWRTAAGGIFTSGCCSTGSCGSSSITAVRRGTNPWPPGHPLAGAILPSHTSYAQCQAPNEQGHCFKCSKYFLSVAGCWVANAAVANALWFTY